MKIAAQMLCLIKLLKLLIFSQYFKFSTHLITGNLGRVDYISEFEYDLFIRPDTCNPRYRVWFNFTVENVKADQVRKGYLHFGGIL